MTLAPRCGYATNHSETWNDVAASRMKWQFITTWCGQFGHDVKLHYPLQYLFQNVEFCCVLILFLSAIKWFYLSVYRSVLCFYYQRINWIKLKNDYKALTANLTNCDSSLWSNAFIISDITFADGWFSSVNGKIRRQSNLTERINTQEIVNSNGTTTRVQLFGTGGFHDSKAGIWKTWRSVHFTPTN